MPHTDSVDQPLRTNRSPSGDPICRRFRWKIGAAILAIAVIAQAICWKVWADDRTLQVFSTWYIWPATWFFLLMWWSFFSGLRRRTRAVSVAGLVAVVGVFFAFCQVTFDGAMWPMISLRSWWFPVQELPDGPTGERSQESVARQQLRKRESLRFAALQKQVADEQSVTQLDPSRFTPAEFLRAGNAKNWQQWESVDGFAIAFGAAARAMFKPNDRSLNRRGWPQFRGLLQDVTVPDVALRTDISSDEPPGTLWAVDQRVGHGWGSFAVVDGLAYTMEQRKDRETTVCYNFASGSQIWTKYDGVDYHGNLGGNGPRSTPTVLGRYLYTLGATGILNCRDVADGGKVWTRNILADAGAKNLAWGLSGSPFVAGNLVFVNAGEGGDKAVIAYNRFTGDIVWATGNEPASYSTPTIARIHGTDQLLVFNGIGLFAYDPNTGTELWKFDEWKNQPKVNVAQPIVVGNQVFISSGYNLGCALLTVKIDDGKWSVDVKVNENRFRLKFNDGVYHRGHVYGLDETILSCVDFKTLEVKWKMRGKFGYGQMLLVGDTLIITTEAGDVVLIPATPAKPSERARFRGLNRHLGTFEKPGVGWNHPVFINGKLLMRNDREAACYELGAGR